MFKTKKQRKMSGFATASRQQCIWGITTATPVTKGVHSRSEGPWRWGTSRITPHFDVLTGEVRSAAAWPGMTKKRLNSDHTGPAQAVLPGVVGVKLRRGGSGVNWLAPGGSFHAPDPFLNQIDAQSWPFDVRNSLAKEPTEIYH